MDAYKEPTLYTVKGVAILDNDGNRILAKYYDKSVFATAKEQKTFEKNLFNKTHRANAEIIMLDGLTCVYRSNVDLFFYVMGSSHENELILMSVLNCLYDAVSQILRKNVEKRVVLENLDIVMLAMDEICDGGIIMEADSSAVVQRVALRTDDIPLGEQTVAQLQVDQEDMTDVVPGFANRWHLSAGAAHIQRSRRSLIKRTVVSSGECSFLG
ncbi:coatomer subunit zeta-1 isoform X2 [Periplaneta americana]|uniref:coatomer subunit zeta-1 isoform X2 n=1 Tax=Periplaneta americana TaxID=6978 RepID=UPI0037E8090C